MVGNALRFGSRLLLVSPDKLFDELVEDVNLLDQLFQFGSGCDVGEIVIDFVSLSPTKIEEVDHVFALLSKR